VNRAAVLVGLLITVLGAWSFWTSMEMLITDILTMDWTLWTALLTLGILGVSIGPTVVILSWIYSVKQARLLAQGMEEQQTYTLPLRCPECKSEIDLHHLEWIGPEEARCPYCSSPIPVRKSTFIGYSGQDSMA
jgi:DNA-directed RNA polymerase subunit RPC12/RpoP